MNLSDLVIPPWVKPAACALALAASFGAGFKVESWRWSASELHAVKAQQKQVQKQADKQHSESNQYEQDRETARVDSDARQAQIRTIYRDVPVDRDCAAPDSVRSVLDNGVAVANARAGAQPGSAVPASARPSQPVG